MGVSEVTGDSMEPILYDGDLILYNLTPQAESDGLHVVNYDGRMAVKRLQRVGRGWRLIPQNRSAGYEPELLKLTSDGFRSETSGDLIAFGVVGRLLFPTPKTQRLHIEQVGLLLRQLFREAASSNLAA